MSEYEKNDVNPYAASYVGDDDSFSGGTPQHVPDYLVWAILETLFCCVPFGVIGIIYAVQANSAKGSGNYHQAVENAKKAKMYLIIGIVGWAVICVAYIVIFGIAAATNNINMN
ncbi:MAG: CD225/dispanin family protein [Planctomycetaceae bacterium]|jgi:hypothetical protein|nr:CD225/dispanin family protein [Planctomycetaceae bacterium]